MTTEHASVWGGTGRPSPAESDRRRKEFVRLIVSGADFAAAAREARIQPMRALAVLSEREMRQLIALDAADTEPQAA
jgi:DNA-binding MarR family transcriptional regulator